MPTGTRNDGLVFCCVSESCERRWRMVGEEVVSSVPRQSHIHCKTVTDCTPTLERIAPQEEFTM